MAMSFSECAMGCEEQCKTYCVDVPLDRCRCFIGCVEACMGDVEWEEE